MGDADEFPDFLSSADLVSLRKPPEEVTQPIIGEKYYTQTESQLDNDVLQCALESHKNILLKKRAAKICDLVEAEWNEERNAVVVSKLKGKFVQHMGHMVEGKILLAPEESIFLLENGTIEIKKGQTIMSSEEAYATILTGDLAQEKYRVYSHLSQLGFIVIPHHETLRVTQYEKKLNLNKRRLDKKRKSTTPLKKLPEKRINFTGAFDSAAHDDTAEDTPERQEVTCSKSIEEPPSQSFDKGQAVFNYLDTNSCEVSVPLSVVEPEGVSLNKNDSSSFQENNQKKEAGKEETLNTEKNGISKFDDKQVNAKTNDNNDKSTAISNLDSSSTGAIVIQDKVLESANVEFQADSVHVDMEVEITTASDQGKCITHSQADKLIDSQIDTDNSQTDASGVEQRVGNAGVETTNADSVMIDAPKELVTDMNSQTESMCIKQGVDNEDVRTVVVDLQLGVSDEVEVMDIDSQLTDTSCNVLESSKEAINLKGNENSNVRFLEETNTESNDVLSCSSTDDESEILSLGVGSDESSLPRSPDDVQVQCLEQEVTLVEVTKKEKVPLAVIELDSEEEPTADNNNNVGSDDEIMVVKECSAPPQVPAGFAKRTHFKSGETLSRQFYNCKKEERSSPTQSSSSAGLTIEFPRLIRTNVVCIPRPPLNLLPCHVKPSKEAYILDLKQKSDTMPQAPGRVWNSFRDMQDYQRQRRLCRSSGQSCPRFQDSKAWNRNTLNDRDSNSNFNNTQNSSSPISPWSAQNTLAPNSPWSNMSNNLTNNSFIGSRHQQVNVSMSQSYHQLSPNNASPFNFGNQSLLPQGQNSNYIRTVHSIASDVVSVIFNQHLNTFQAPLNAPGFNSNLPYRPSNSGNFGNAFGAPNNAAEPFFAQNQRRNFRPHRGAPFPCHYRGVQQKRSWDQVKSAIGQDLSDDKNGGSDIEEVPINPSEVLWDPTNITPLVKPGTRLEVSAVLKSLQKTQLAELTKKLGPKTKSLPTVCSLEISFDVYLPGFNYRKTCPDIPKHRIIVMRSIDPVPKYSEIAFLQKKWNDGALLQIAVVDNGDVSFHSFTSVSLPALVPHET